MWQKNVESPRILWALLETHLDEASFLWWRWEEALRAPSLPLEEVAIGVERRLEAHLDGLVVSGLAGVTRILEPGLTGGNPGEAFAAASALLRLAEPRADCLRRLLETLDEDGRAEVFRALELHPTPSATSWLHPLLNHEEGTLVAGALRVLMGWDVDPNRPVMAFLEHDDPVVVGGALKSLTDLPHENSIIFNRLMNHRAPEIATEVLMAIVRLGHAGALESCRAMLERRLDLDVAVYCLRGALGDGSDVRWLVARLEDSEVRTKAMRALGFAGTREAVEACLEHMAADELARLAGEAFSEITGLDMGADGCSIEETPVAIVEPIDLALEDLDAELGFDSEAALARPDVDGVRRWWQAYEGKFEPERRYVRGIKWGEGGLVQALWRSSMRQRAVWWTMLCAERPEWRRLRLLGWARDQARWLKERGCV